MAGIYRQHHPEHSAFYRVFFYYFERFLREYEDRFERAYGFLRPVIKDVVEKYLECGNPMCDFARIARVTSHIPDKGQVMIRKVYEVDPLRCPSCGGQMSFISFIEEPKTIDRIIGHLKLTFEAERPPPPRVVQQDLLMAVEESEEYF